MQIGGVYLNSNAYDKMASLVQVISLEGRFYFVYGLLEGMHCYIYIADVREFWILVA